MALVKSVEDVSVRGFIKLTTTTRFPGEVGSLQGHPLDPAPVVGQVRSCSPTTKIR